MADPKKLQPTTPEPILVASGTGGDHAAEFLLTMLDWLLGDEMCLVGNLEGDISTWIENCFEKSVTFQRHNIPETNKQAVQREVMREAAEIVVDLKKKGEIQIGGLLETLPADGMHRVMQAIQSGDSSAVQKLRSEFDKTLLENFAKPVNKEGLSALGSIVARCRASRAGALCMAFYKEHPLALIDQARRGNPDAVIKLIKIDKLFLTDRCTHLVIKQAGLQNNRVFLNRLARASKYKPKTNWRQGCRLYIYLLLAMNWEGPLTALLHRVDPDGKRFKTFDAFEKFVERSRKEFSRMQATAEINRDEEKVAG